MSRKFDFRIKGLHCSHESKELEKHLLSKEGVKKVQINLLKERLTLVDSAEETVSFKKILGWIEEVGLKAFPWDACQAGEKNAFIFEHKEISLLFLSGIFLIVGALFSLEIQGVIEWNLIKTALGTFAFSMQTFYLLSVCCSAFFIIPKAFFSLKQLRLDIHVLMIVAVIGACFLGEWFEAAMVTFLFSLGALLEKKSLKRCEKAVSTLLDLSPQTATVIEEEKMLEKGVEEVQVGALILVRPGEKIPLDSKVEKGVGMINQASITGESMPVTKEVGDSVYAGTINGESVIECRVMKQAKDSKLSKTLELIEEAQLKRGVSEKRVDQFARIYTPIMVGLACLIALLPPLFLGGSWAEWISRALIILVISCPCALVISTPISIVSGLTAAAKHGVLIKGGSFLERPAKLQALALDKTGTLTVGKPTVQQVIPLNGHTENEILKCAAALEASSTHPIAGAIVKETKDRGILFKRAKPFEIIQGKGAFGMIENTRYWIGSHRFIREMKQETAEIQALALRLEDAGHSLVAIGNQRHVCGLISLADSPRAEARLMIRKLKKEGVKKVAMLTGDNMSAATAIARLTGVDSHRAELLPEDKVKEIEKLKKECGSVGMVGDGINDAPAMAAADFGIAMGALGSDVAIETADIALMTDDLSKIPWLLAHSKATLKIIEQNILFAIGIKTLFLALAILGISTLWMAILADTGASLLVVCNGLRLLKR